MPNATHSPIWFYYIPSSYRNLIKNFASWTWFLSKQKNRVKLDSYLIMNLMIFRWGRGHTRLPNSEPAQTGLDLPQKNPHTKMLLRGWHPPTKNRGELHPHPKSPPLILSPTTDAAISRVCAHLSDLHFRKFVNPLRKKSNAKTETTPRSSAPSHTKMLQIRDAIAKERCSPWF